MLTIDGKRLDDPQRCYVIAEASGNHAQDYARAEALVYAAADAGADAVKFQTFTADEIAAAVPIPRGLGGAAHDAWLERLGAQTLRDLFAHGGLPRPWHFDLKRLAEMMGLAFLSTPFSLDAARFLVEEVQVPALKIASGDLTFTPLLQYAASTGLPILLSTGGAWLAEVQHALHVISSQAQASTGVVVLQCVSSYPCPPVACNLRAIQTLQQRTLCDAVGWSDHTLDYELIPALAVSYGASVLEKHLKLEGDHESIDAAHSLSPSQFKRMVEVIRMVPLVLGSGVKEPQQLEMHDRLFARRDPSDWLRPQMRGRLGDWE